MGEVLAVNREAVEGRNASNDCALNRSHKRRFTTLYLYTFTFVMLNCLVVLFCVCGIRLILEHFLHLLLIVKFFCICILSTG